MSEYDLSHEMWREYEWINRHGQRVVYRIENPVRLYIRRPGGSTHRVSDAMGVVHCVPAVEVYGCILRWQNKPQYSRCEF